MSANNYIQKWMMPTILSSFFLIFSAVFVIVAIPSVRAAVISAPPYVLNLSNGLVAYWTFDYFTELAII